jgi:enamine deaminase RidA (YjgF/YER057c/UK114 family)
MAQLTHTNPPALNEPQGYTHVVEARGQRLIYVSGQIAFNSAGELVGRGDLRAQTTQVWENIQAALEAVGASLSDVVKLNTYVVNYSPDQRPVLAEVRSRFLGPDRRPASTLVGVASLALDGLLVEIEAFAVTY